MCGIFGFSLTNKLDLTISQTRKLIECGVLHNRHRGVDAGGFALQLSDGSTVCEKRPEDPQTNFSMKELAKLAYLGDNAKPVRTGIVHTRAATRGDPQDNQNNHPVIHDGVYVTHNGTVTNFEQIKKKYLKDTANTPLVDSWVIPLTLANVLPDPTADGWWNSELVTDVWAWAGGVAFAALWDKHPGWVLLARVKNSPLVVARHQEYGVLWASEKEALMRGLQILGFNGKKQAQDWVFYELDQGAFVMLQDGQPMHWGKFKTTSTRYNNNHILYERWSLIEDMKVPVARAARNSYIDSVWPALSAFKYDEPDVVDDVEFVSRADFKKAALSSYEMFCDADWFIKRKTALKYSDLYSVVYVSDPPKETKDRKIMLIEIAVTANGSVKDTYRHTYDPFNDQWINGAVAWKPARSKDSQDKPNQERVYADAVEEGTALLCASYLIWRKHMTQDFHYSSPKKPKGPRVRTTATVDSGVSCAVPGQTERRNMQTTGRPPLQSISQTNRVAINGKTYHRLFNNLVVMEGVEHQKCDTHGLAVHNHLLSDVMSCPFVYTHIMRAMKQAVQLAGLPALVALFGARTITLQEPKDADEGKTPCQLLNPQQPHSFRPSHYLRMGFEDLMIPVEYNCTRCGCVYVLDRFPHNKMNHQLFNGHQSYASYCVNAFSGSEW